MRPAGLGRVTSVVMQQLPGAFRPGEVAVKRSPSGEYRRVVIGEWESPSPAGHPGDRTAILE